jgi:transcriptional repressor NrdR
MVIKKDGRREPFDRNKLLAGVVKACEKRPISMERLEKLATAVEHSLEKDFQREAKSKAIGELVMKKLYDLDEVAYVRFASVYRQFKDVNQFMKEIKHLLK